jgi:PAS domain S-box-containing protein
MNCEANTVEQQFRQMAQLFTNDVFWIVDLDGTWRFVSPAYKAISGMSAESLYQYPAQWLKGIHPDDRARIRAAIKNLSTQVLDGEYRIVRPDGELRWCYLRGYPIKDHAGNTVIFAGMIKDITQQKLIQEELRIKDQAIASSINGIAMTDLQGRLCYVNAAFLRMWGYQDRSDVLGRHATEFWHAKDQAENVMAAVRQSGAWHARLLARKADDQTFYTQLSANLIKNDAGQPVGLMASFVDITKQLKAEKIQSESEQRFRNLVETTSDWVWEVDHNAVYTYVSPQIVDLLGYQPQEVLGKTPFDFMPPAEALRVKELLDVNFSQNIPFNYLENINLHKDGREVVLETSGVPYFGADGEFQGYRGIDRNITERKNSQHLLSVALNNLQTIMDTVQDLIFKVDLEGKILSWNKYTEQVTGYNAAELYGRSAITFVQPSDRQAVNDTILKTIATGRAEVEINLVHKNGSMSLFQCICVAVTDDTDEVVGITGVGRDITEHRKADLALQKEKAEQEVLLKRLQETQNQLLQSEKMASIGQLAAGVAHEINNPVGYINSNVSSLKQYVLDLFTVIDTYEAAEKFITDEDTLANIHTIKQKLDLAFLKQDIMDLMSESQEGVSRVKQIVQDLKDFSHTDSGEWIWADLHQGLNSTLNIAHNELKYKTQVVKEYGDLPQIECMPSQLNQVFMNLLVNAAHAIEEHGTITIRTGVENDEWIWIEITDTGKGIAPEHLNRIFDPFFTTKPVGKGTGLGLSLSYSIVEKHGGHIEVKSKPGHGSKFTVKLPVNQSETKLAIAQ